ncbi:MAG TPA: M3 family metallopeptidase [Bdellovibrionota bacterium]|nr:M3 family metallopeptidase [Bdellovibrionota bacterium]
MKKKSSLAISGLLLLGLATGNVACLKAPPPKRARSPVKTAQAGTADALAAQTQVSQLSAKDVETKCARALPTFTARIQKIPKVPKDSRKLESTLLALETALADLDDATAEALLQQSIGEDENTRSEAQACAAKREDALATALSNQELFDVIDEAVAQEGEDKRLKEALVARMKAQGAGLSDETKKQLHEKQKRLAALEAQYEKAIARPAGNFALTEEQIKDVPALKGRTTIGFTPADAALVLEGVPSSATRKAYYLAYQSRGSAENQLNFPEILKIRGEIARIHGRRTWAEHVIKTADARDPETVARRLSEMKDQLSKKAGPELVALQNYRREKLETASTALEAWDVDYAAVRYAKATFGLDLEATTQALKRAEVLAGILKAFGEALGLKIEELKSGQSWSPSVKSYSIAADKDVLGTLHIDLAGPKDRLPGARVVPLRTRRSAAGKSGPASVALIASMPENLRPAQVSRLIHELAHAFHHLSYTGKYASLSGLNAGPELRELPADTLENWGFEAEVLKRAGLSDDQAKALAQARAFARSYQLLKRVFAAKLDLALHDESMDVAQVATKASKLHHDVLGQSVEFKGFPAVFRMNGGLWTSVLGEGYAADLYTEFKGRALEESVGKEFRAKVLARGITVPGMTLMRDFLDREPSPAEGLKQIFGL